MTFLHFALVSVTMCWCGKSFNCTELSLTLSHLHVSWPSTLLRPLGLSPWMPRALPGRISVKPAFQNLPHALELPLSLSFSCHQNSQCSIFPGLPRGRKNPQLIHLGTFLIGSSFVPILKCSLDYFLL